MSKKSKLVTKFHEKYKQLKRAGQWEDFKNILHNGELDAITLMFTYGGMSEASRALGLTAGGIFKKVITFIKYADLIMQGKGHTIKRRSLRKRKTGAGYVLDKKYGIKTEELKEKTIEKTIKNKKENELSTNEILDKMIDILIIKLLKNLQK